MDPPNSTVNAQVETCFESHEQVSWSDSDCDISDARPNHEELDVQIADSGLRELVEDNEEDSSRYVLRKTLTIR
jgi:hypothetical protein